MAEILETSVITLARRRKLCEVTSGKVNSIAAVTHIAFGEGGIDGEGNPTQPSELLESLKEPVGTYPIEAVEYPVDTTARYTAIIPRDDLPGAKISEAALVDADGDLVAIKNMYVKQKDAGVIFTFTFDDQF